MTNCKRTKLWLLVLSLLADKDELNSFIFAEMKPRIYDVNALILPQSKRNLNCVYGYIYSSTYFSSIERWMPKTEMLLISVDKVAMRHSPFAEL